MVTVRKFCTLQDRSERHTLNDEYQNFLTTHMACTQLLLSAYEPKQEQNVEFHGSP